MNRNCNICSDLLGSPKNELGNQYAELSSSRSNIIEETENLVILPSVGPLNDSHVLIIPKKHFHSFAELPKTTLDETFLVISELREFFRGDNQELIFFESGAGKKTDHSGGCIVHAHIHCLSASPTFHNSILNETNLSPLEDKLESIADTNLGYVWYLDKDSNQYICNNPLLPSQFLRYLYAESTNQEKFWNWRSKINIEGVVEVLHRYKSFNLKAKLA